MRLFLDQNLPRDLAALLDGPLFDVADTRSRGLQRAPDEELLAIAAAESRVIVSADTDFGELLAKSHANTPSFVLLRKTDGLSAEEVANLLAVNLPAFEDELNAGAILVITDTTVRIRALPVLPGGPAR